MDEIDPAPPKPSRAAFTFIFITVALDMLALGVVIPVVPKLLVQLKGGDVGSAAKVLGLFGFLWAGMQFIFSPLLGALSDRFGRRPIVLLSNFGLGLDGVLMALAPSVNWLLLGRVISGITSASVPTASAYIADVTEPAERAARFGQLGAAFGLGFIIGPAFGGLLASYHLRLPFWVSAALSLGNAAYGFFILPESLPAKWRSPFTWASAHPLGGLQFLATRPLLWAPQATLFLHYLANESLPSVFVLYADYRYAWSETTVGLVLALVGIASTAVSGFLSSRIVARLGERRMVVYALWCGVVGFTIYAAAPRGFLFLTGIPITAFWVLAGPGLQSVMTRSVSVSEQGQLQGAISSLRGIGGMAGPLIFTQIFAASVAHSVAHKEGWLPVGSPYYLAGWLLMVALLLCARITWENPARS
jgi:DHA1 family tetracycline resistance protein-like MFS transporter